MILSTWLSPPGMRGSAIPSPQPAFRDTPGLNEMSQPI